MDKEAGGTDKALPGSAHIPSVARSEIEAQCMWALGMPLGTVMYYTRDVLVSPVLFLPVPWLTRVGGVGE